MKLRTQLYIDTSIEGQKEVYELIDFFDFESIEITETIKNIQEVDVVFTDYTKEFVVPASKNNNKIFSHYYSTKLVNSYDARIKRKARIFINGIFFKQGYVRLSAAQVKNGYPYSYSLNFFGALSGLGDVIGETKLSELDYLERYSHEFNLSNVFSGLKKGLQYNGTAMEEFSNVSRDIVYPLISVENKWFYNSLVASGESTFKEGFSVNIYNQGADTNPDATYGIDYKQLKPAIKVSNIFDAIEEKYDSINFKRDSFVYSSKLKDLYLLMHNRKGTFSQGVGNADDRVRDVFLVYTQDGRSDFKPPTPLPSGFEELRPIETNTTLGFFNFPIVTTVDISFNVDIIQPSSGEDIEYYLTIFDGATALASKTSDSDSDSISYTLRTENFKRWDNLRLEVASTGSVSEYSVSMTLTNTLTIEDNQGNTTSSKSANYVSKETSYAFPQTVNLYQQMPDMKVIDFMTGIFKMFNLVAKVDDNTGEIDILPLNDFYLSGTDRDITNYVDTFNYDIERLQLYGNYNFKYEDASTYGLINHNEINQDDYGNLKYPENEEKGNDGFIFDEGVYDIEVPFEKLYYSRLTDENTGFITDICEGWLVNEDQEPELPKPILFFNVNTDIDTSKYRFGLKGQAEYISTYNRASNTNSDGLVSLNFNSEIDEFTLQVNSNSLFSEYYSSYIKNTFNKESRNLKIEGRLPLSFLYEYSLADRLLFNGSPFIINEITTNLNTGKSQLDLITAYDIKLDEFVDIIPPDDVAGLAIDSVGSDRFRIIWNQNIESDLKGYKLYLDGVVIQTLGFVNTARVFNLNPTTNYKVRVTAFDEAGNESAFADATELSITTGAVSDLIAPSIPTNLRTNLIGSSGFTVEWDASTDNVGVSLYKVYVDGVLQTPSNNNTFYTVTSLSPKVGNYEVRVTAEDASGNVSLKSAPLFVRTVNT